MANEWRNHVKKTMENMKKAAPKGTTVMLRDVLKAAKSTYKKGASVVKKTAKKVVKKTSKRKTSKRKTSKRKTSKRKTSKRKN